MSASKLSCWQPLPATQVHRTASHTDRPGAMFAGRPARGRARRREVLGVRLWRGYEGARTSEACPWVRDGQKRASGHLTHGSSTHGKALRLRVLGVSGLPRGWTQAAGGRVLSGAVNKQRRPVFQGAGRGEPWGQHAERSEPAPTHRPCAVALPLGRASVWSRRAVARGWRRGGGSAR